MLLRQLMLLVLVVLFVGCGDSVRNFQRKSPDPIQDQLEPLKLSDYFGEQSVEQIIGSYYKADPRVECQFWFNMLEPQVQEDEVSPHWTLNFALGDYNYETKRSPVFGEDFAVEGQVGREFETRFQFVNLNIIPMVIDEAQKIAEPLIALSLAACGEEKVYDSDHTYNSYGRCELPTESNSRSLLIKEGETLKGGPGNIAESTQFFTVPYFYKCNLKVERQP